MWAWWKMGLAGLLLGASGGCPSGSGDQGPVDECTQIGQQCHLEKGVIGVCSPTQEHNCDEPPCLTCTPQH